MRHKASRPLIDLWLRLPRAAARLLGKVAKLGPAQSLVAMVMVLSLGTGAYVAASSVIGGSTKPPAESADLGLRYDPTVSSGGELPDLPDETPSSAGQTPNGSSSGPGPGSAGQSEAPVPTTGVTPTERSASDQVSQSPSSGTGTPSASPSQSSGTPSANPSQPGLTSSATPAQPSATPSTPKDITPPNTSLSGEFPEGDAAQFWLSTNEPASFSCSLDGAAYTSCDSPALFSDLDPGWHTFFALATDAAGNVDPTPAAFRWHARGGRPADR